ncbi:MAG: helix-turn-helix domain-containing protein [Chitinivibrionales bacterium]|nr:helix-turn-helix domain-containing protein [Chitinivibrionales bacterium]
MLSVMFNRGIGILIVIIGVHVWWFVSESGVRSHHGPWPRLELLRAKRVTQSLVEVCHVLLETRRWLPGRRIGGYGMDRAVDIRPERIDRTIGPPGREQNLAAGFVVSPRCNYDARNVVLPFYTVLYVLRGRGMYALEGGRSWELSAGTFVHRFPRVAHRVVRDRTTAWREFFLVLPPSLYEALLALGVLDPSRPVLHPGLTHLTYTRLRTFLSDVPHDSGVSSAQLLAEAHGLVAHMIDMHRARWMQTDEATMLRRARELLAADLDGRLHMPSVARELGVGYETFRKAFRRHQGLSPKEYRIRRRIDLARHLLMVEQAPVKEIAARLGYPDMPSFVKQFRRVAGVTPNRFRQTG